MFSNTYRPSKTQVHSISFQNFWPVEICLRRNEARLERFFGAGSLFRPAPLRFVSNPRNHSNRCKHRKHPARPSRVAVEKPAAPLSSLGSHPWTQSTRHYGGGFQSLGAFGFALPV
jgi:hypothetical protein